MHNGPRPRSGEFLTPAAAAATAGRCCFCGGPASSADKPVTVAIVLRDGTRHSFSAHTRCLRDAIDSSFLPTHWFSEGDSSP